MKELEVWHPINGKWFHIYQVIEDGECKYYTNGVLEKFLRIGTQKLCMIKIRPSYKGYPTKYKVEELNGKVLLMDVMWRCEDGEKYPGEFALQPSDPITKDHWFHNYDLVWIASGDVEILD